MFICLFTKLQRQKYYKSISNIPLYIGKNPVEKLCEVLEMELKTYTPVGLKFAFEKIKFKVLHYIQRFHSSTPKIRLACPKTLLLTISSSNTVTHSNSYIKEDKYFFFYKSRSGKCSPETKVRYILLKLPC